MKDQVDYQNTNKASMLKTFMEEKANPVKRFMMRFDRTVMSSLKNIRFELESI
jgi:hypothetical protein